MRSGYLVLEVDHHTLLLDLNVISEQRWIQFELQNSPSRVFAFDGKTYTTI